MHNRTAAVKRDLPDYGILNSVRLSLKERGRRDDKTLIEGYHERLSRKRNEHLAGQYEGETAYVLTCGPSIDEVWNESLRESLADELVLAVKQTHELAPEITDIHLYNEVRTEAYTYPAETIKVSCSQFVSELPSHIHYPIEDYEWDEALFVTDEYEKWALDNSYVRPWGIGIMFEIGMHLPVHLGCDKVLIMGFDMNKEGEYHFYDDDPDQDSEAYDVDEREFVYAQRSAPSFVEWANSRGVEVRLYSPLSALDIPEADDLDEWL